MAELKAFLCPSDAETLWQAMQPRYFAPAMAAMLFFGGGVPPEIADDRSFELWYVRGDEPIAAGTFEPGEDITALLNGDMEPGDIIAVTVEEQGGSPDGTPTTDPIIAIPTNPGDA